MKKDAGFTLIDLMVAISIIAILSGFTIVNYMRWLPKYKLGSAARSMQCTIQLARVAAVNKNSTVTVEFSTADNTCLASYIQDGSEKLIRKVDMPAGIDLKNPTFGSTLQFNNRGLPNFDGEVVMKNSDKSKTIRLLLSGKSRIL